MLDGTKQTPARAEAINKISDHFGDSYENVGDVKIEKEPQNRSRSLEWLSRSDTAENPAKANIQGVDTL